MSTPRVTPQEVREIINVDSSVDLSPYITAAHSIVENFVKPQCDYTDDQLKELERWLSAHFYAASPVNNSAGGGIGSKKEGDLSISYGVQYSSQLGATSYGQQAKVLDYCGALSKLGKQSPSWNVIS